jgi:hypothetical protein
MSLAKSGRKPRHSREEVLDAALDLFDVDGVSGFNLRTLADRLDLTPMARRVGTVVAGCPSARARNPAVIVSIPNVEKSSPTQARKLNHQSRWRIAQFGCV